jgi:hypothetical protein
VSVFPGLEPPWPFCGTLPNALVGRLRSSPELTWTFWCPFHLPCRKLRVHHRCDEAVSNELSVENGPTTDAAGCTLLLFDCLQTFDKSFDVAQTAPLLIFLYFANLQGATAVPGQLSLFGVWRTQNVECARKVGDMKRNNGTRMGLCLLFFVASLKVQATTWSFTGSMQQARNYFSATLLNNGQVLVVGGSYRGTFVQYGLTSAELYNPATGTFSPTGSLNTGRYGHSATLLNNGKVLIAGGANSTSGSLSSAELYDPGTGTFTATGSMSCACGYSATMLASGKVLFTGGFKGTNAVSTAELYDPATGTFLATGSLVVARAGPSLTLLANGKVLVAGGVYYTGVSPNAVAHYLSSAELYDPTTETFALTGSLYTARSGQSATLLQNGNVLLAAGQNDNTQNYGYLASAELYNPSTGKFSITGSLNTPRFLHRAHLLSSGQVLIVAGNHFGSIASAELYDASNGTFSVTASLNTPRQGHASALLTNGQVLAVGGYESQLGNHRGYLASAELFH